jgi:hypothetical protein
MTDLAMPELRDALVAAARARQEQALGSRIPSRPGAARPRPGRARSRASRGPLGLALALLVLACAAAAFASGLISFGSPAGSVPVFANPRVGLGKLAGGSVRLLPISVADPHGGPPWGLRLLTTTRGAGCLQAGRLVDGRLAALGQDGAFGDDGRAHELPVSANIERLNCALLDGHGRLFESVTIKSEAASAAPGVHCRPPGTYPPSLGATPKTCPLADERNLYFGTLGPDAASVTYSLGGRAHTLDTLGSDGAYLIVTTGTPHRYTGSPGSSERAALYSSDEVPVYSPITAIHYRNGATCHLRTAERWIYGPSACSPALPEPFGYAPTPAPSSAQVATPIHAVVVKAPKHGWEVRLHFTSRVAIQSLRGQYEVESRGSALHERGVAFQEIGEAPSPDGGLIPQGRNVAAGQIISVTIAPPPPDARTAGVSGLAPGLLSGRVVLDYHDGTLMQAEEDRVPVVVGSFSVRVP